MAAAPRGREALRIPEALEELPGSQVPPEVEATLLSLGFPSLVRCERVKSSFHATFFLDFEGPLPGTSQSRAVLQLIGSELGDKPFFDPSRPISATSIAKATGLALDLGIKVPRVLATGMVEEWGHLQAVPFVVYEFLVTKTVEDKVKAPEKEWRRIFGELRGKLEGRSLADVDTDPLPRFEDCFAYVAHLLRLAQDAQAADLEAALARVEQQLRDSGICAEPPRLIHQDLNDGNILCSPDPAGPKGAWCLDGLIDWESAAVGDPRILFERGEAWSVLRKLSLLTKARWLAAVACGTATGSSAGAILPRCNAEELVEEYEEVASSLVRKGWLASVSPLPDLE